MRAWVFTFIYLSFPITLINKLAFSSYVQRNNNNIMNARYDAPCSVYQVEATHDVLCDDIITVRC